ncbi:hypothetical protein ACF3MZ_09910 [Paenibacillaceae bacterium WGS1546]|uniref:hypothetical protein n=1 Tax=Cohnella sp. WGS1546 TaxID=3366810 RepID=UPI00372D6552
MEKTIYEIQYNEGFIVRMISDSDSMGQLEFDKRAFEAVLADMVLRAREQPANLEDVEALWRWGCAQLGLALQKTVLAEDGDRDPLDTLIHTAFRLKGMSNAEGTEREQSVSPAYLMEHLLSYIHKEDHIESVIYVARMNDGSISTGWTDLAHTEAIGLLEVGKLQVAKEMGKDRDSGK